MRALRSAARSAPVDWMSSAGLTPYLDAVSFMEQRVADIAGGRAGELVWLLEHPPLYTAGTSARPEDMLEPGRFPVFRTGRGGKHTYHGPGQRVVYVMLDVGDRGGDVRAFVGALEGWVIDALAAFQIVGEARAGRVGVWVRRPDKTPETEDKIAAIGIRLRRWISFHGLSINVDCNLEHFSGVVPCGVTEGGVTSLADLGRPASMAAVDAALRETFTTRFSRTRTITEDRLGAHGALLADTSI